ncbi:MAG: hypothetical protein QG671_314, partial [Actinomycetota bacterium]|nr:hypothetical protein [Actinomycetota bacterium]
ANASAWSRQSPARTGRSERGPVQRGPHDRFRGQYPYHLRPHPRTKHGNEQRWARASHRFGGTRKAVSGRRTSSMRRTWASCLSRPARPGSSPQRYQPPDPRQQGRCILRHSLKVPARRRRGVPLVAVAGGSRGSRTGWRAGPAARSGCPPGHELLWAQPAPMSDAPTHFSRGIR